MLCEIINSSRPQVLKYFGVRIRASKMQAGWTSAIEFIDYLMALAIMGGVFGIIIAIYMREIGYLAPVGAIFLVTTPYAWLRNRVFGRQPGEGPNRPLYYAELRELAGLMEASTTVRVLMTSTLHQYDAPSLYALRKARVVYAREQVKETASRYRKSFAQ